MVNKQRECEIQLSKAALPTNNVKKRKEVKIVTNHTTGFPNAFPTRFFYALFIFTRKIDLSWAIWEPCSGRMSASPARGHSLGDWGGSRKRPSKVRPRRGKELPKWRTLTFRGERKEDEYAIFLLTRTWPQGRLTGNMLPGHSAQKACNLSFLSSWIFADIGGSFGRSVLKYRMYV